MSTRSGKRLHNSPNGNIEPEHVSKDKKTRNKRAVDNDNEKVVTSKSKKRQNYVSFPAAEESSAVDGVEAEMQMKPARALRRNTLKEQNVVAEEVETVVSVKKLVRSTRRTKMFSETAADEAPEVPPSEEPVEVVTITTGKPKSKKNKKKSKKRDQPEIADKENETNIGKKKKNKKKKNSQSNSSVQRDKPEEKKRNVSNVSTDSFHSAAGSPVHEIVSPPLNRSSPKFVEAENQKRRSGLKRMSGFNTSVPMAADENTNIDKEVEPVVRQSKRRRSSIKLMPNRDSKVVNTSEKVDLNATFETESEIEGSSKKRRKCNPGVVNTEISLTLTSSTTNLVIPNTCNVELNTTFEKDDSVIKPKIHKNKKSDNKDQARETLVNMSQSLSIETRQSPRKSMSDKNTANNGSFDMSPKPYQTKLKSLDSTFDKETKLDSTFDKESKLDSTFDKTSKKASLGSKSSLITSDDATNSSIVTLDKSDSKISITDDDCKTENILNTTPLLIESSMEESKILESSLKEKRTPEPKTVHTSPLKREGTFTKDGPDVSLSPKTPNKGQTLPAAGCTPYHSDRKGSQKKRSVMNLTHSIEKGARSPAPRTTRVMFCSPVNLPGVATQRKTKIIKSNLKGSNKSFVFDESMSSLVPERAPTAGARTQPQRSPRPAPRAAPAARARTTSAMAKLSSTPGKAGTPRKPQPQSEAKATRLPNFAALHARRFERMESLAECQLRRQRRAQLLLAPHSPAATPNKLEPKPRDSPLKAAAPPALQRGYTRFGFKMPCDVNPFSVPPAPKPEDKPKVNGPGKANGVNKPGLKEPAGGRRAPAPSLSGATSARRAAARAAVLRGARAHSAADTRQETRTVIKGVRTNRRFELQMQARNING